MPKQIPQEMVEAIAKDVRIAEETYEFALVTYNGAMARAALNKYCDLCDTLHTMSVTLAEMRL
jgi:hypothetical protein